MKFSIYNSILQLDDNYTLLYNANSDKFVVLTAQAALNYGKGIDFLAKRDNNLFKDLQEVKAIVDDNVNEIGDLCDKVKSIVEDDSLFELHINPTLDCNFNCWYCYENHIKGSKMSEKTLTAIQKYVSKTLSIKTSIKSFHLSFFGGEPLMYFQRVALPLIKYAQEECKARNIDFSAHFTSNGFLINDRIIEALGKVNVDFQITLDGDKTNHNKTRFLKNGVGSYDRICSNIKKVASRGHNVYLRINYTLKNINSIASILSTIKDIPQEYKKCINVDFQRVWQDSDKDLEESETLSEQLNQLFKIFRDEGFSVSFCRVQNTVTNPCYGDRRNNLLINYDGIVFSCTARNFTSDFSEGEITDKGDINWFGKLKEQRIASKFNRSECHHCRIAPICGGGCTQNALERKNIPGCLRGLNEQDIDKLILERFEFMFISNKI